VVYNNGFGQAFCMEGNWRRVVYGSGDRRGKSYGRLLSRYALYQVRVNVLLRMFFSIVIWEQRGKIHKRWMGRIWVSSKDRRYKNAHRPGPNYEI